MNRTAKDISEKLLTTLSFAVGFNQRISKYKIQKMTPQRIALQCSIFTLSFAVDFNQRISE
jgi:hypothetical protein